VHRGVAARKEYRHVRKVPLITLDNPSNVVAHPLTVSVAPWLRRRDA
jgi:hypothetical protein